MHSGNIQKGKLTNSESSEKTEWTTHLIVRNLKSMLKGQG